ncbi:MAG: HAMP domain-containing protein, partial [Magnetococcales bacterium]|nr:HAMP domain-containing protein [Magnetococcales bacterium]
MIPFQKASLTQKIIFSALGGFLLTIVFLVDISESQLEHAMLDQVYKQAQSFLIGLSHHLEAMPTDSSPEQYSQELRVAMAPERHHFLHFTPREIYLYSASGRVLGHTEAGPHPDKEMDGVYGQVIRNGEPVISSDLSRVVESNDFDSHPTIDVIIPVRLGGTEVNAGLEAELDMHALMKHIKNNDDAYEKRIIVLTSACGLVLFLFIWWLLHRLAIRHVNQFALTMSEFGHGAMDARIPLPLPQDEIGALGRSINNMADNIRQLMQDQEESYLQTLQSLSKALEAKDSYTQSHSARVSK